MDEVSRNYEITENSERSTQGCKECRFSGYQGRIAIFELLILDDEIRSLISERPVAFEIRKMAKNKGMRGLRADGWVKAVQGITSLAEVLRVTQGVEEEDRRE